MARPEDYILKNTENLYDLKVNVFTGPIFRPDDVLYRNKFQIPAEFWKVVSMKTKVNKISADLYSDTKEPFDRFGICLWWI